MAFNDISFLFVFFPGILLLHTLMPTPGRNILLLVASLVFYAWGSPEYVLLLVLSILFNYFSGLQIGHQKAEGRSDAARFTLITAVAVNLLLLGFFKYWGFVLENVNGLLGTSIPVRRLSMPIGISFFTFSILSYLFDVYRDKAPAAKNILEFSLFVTFFPKLVSGPIVQYQDMAEELKERKVTRVRFGAGCRLFLVGLAKKVLLANTLGTTFYAVTALPAGDVSVATAWLGTICYTLMLYFDFSGYSDMAIGLGHMFGFSFDKNFDYPYLADSITDFWRRWHISLGAWFRDYVYIPLGGSRAGLSKNIRNLLIVWLLTGIWHGANWTFILWGLYHGGIQMLDKFVFKPVLDKTPRVVKVVTTLLLVMIGWVFFFSSDLGFAFRWLGQMFGIGADGFLNATSLYYYGSGWLVVAISAFCAYPVGTRLGSNIYHGSKNAVALSTLWYAALLLLCIGGMMSSTYSSFLYFQF